MEQGLKLINIQLGKTFGYSDVPETALIQVYDRKSNIPYIDQFYKFNRLTLKKLFVWLSDDSTNRNMIITGDSGVGKSSLFIEFAARMNRDIYALSCSGKTRFEDLVGSISLNKDGSSSFVDGPLTKAYREGGIFLANEVSRMEPGEQMRFADVLDERSSLTVPQTGEVLFPHKDFRFAATGNSKGTGDERGVYAGEKRGSTAFYKRFTHLQIVPLSLEEEVELLLAKVPELGEDLVKMMVSYAREIRSIFNNSNNSKGVSLTTDFPPRSVEAWGKLSVQYKKFTDFSGKKASADAPVLEALKDTFLNGAPDDEVSALKELYVNWFGKS